MTRDLRDYLHRANALLFERKELSSDEKWVLESIIEAAQHIWSVADHSERVQLASLHKEVIAPILAEAEGRMDNVEDVASLRGSEPVASIDALNAYITRLHAAQVYRPTRSEYLHECGSRVAEMYR